jgi:CheY-like chemotaxis protein
MNVKHPYVVAPGVMENAIKRSQKGFNMMKVLIVDDNIALTGLLKEVLETEGDYNIKTAENGEAGYKTFLKFKPDVILTDIEMPVKNGLDMVKDIREHDPDIKTIYMSGDLNRYRTRLEKEKMEHHADLVNKPLCFSKVLGLFHA